MDTKGLLTSIVLVAIIFSKYTDTPKNSEQKVPALTAISLRSKVQLLRRLATADNFDIAGIDGTWMHLEIRISKQNLKRMVTVYLKAT